MSCRLLPRIVTWQMASAIWGLSGLGTDSTYGRDQPRVSHEVSRLRGGAGPTGVGPGTVPGTDPAAAPSAPRAGRGGWGPRRGPRRSARGGGLGRRARGPSQGATPSLRRRCSAPRGAGRVGDPLAERLRLGRRGRADTDDARVRLEGLEAARHRRIGRCDHGAGAGLDALVADRERRAPGDDDVRLLLARLRLVVLDAEFLAWLAHHGVDPERVHVQRAVQLLPPAVRRRRDRLIVQIHRTHEIPPIAYVPRIPRMMTPPPTDSRRQRTCSIPAARHIATT